MPVVMTCPKCGEQKDKIDKEGVWRCTKCRKARSKELRAEKRAEKGLQPLGSGRRAANCYKCGGVKENPKVGYCHACKAQQNKDWMLRTGRTERHRTGKCRCGNEFASYSTYQCVDCYRKYRDKQRQNPEFRERTFKVDVRLFTRNCIKSGVLIKEPCKVCGTNENIEAHHDDYSKPLDIIWLCRHHHRELHKNSHLTK
jgi:hypothetical protein